MENSIKIKRELNKKEIDLTKVLKETITLELYHIINDDDCNHTMLDIHYTFRDEAFNEYSTGNGFICSVRGTNAKEIFKTAKEIVQNEYEYQMESKKKDAK